MASLDDKGLRNSPMLANNFRGKGHSRLMRRLAYIYTGARFRESGREVYTQPCPRQDILGAVDRLAKNIVNKLEDTASNKLGTWSSLIIPVLVALLLTKRMHSPLLMALNFFGEGVAEK